MTVAAAGYGSGRISSANTAEKIAVVGPIPNPRADHRCPGKRGIVPHLAPRIPNILDNRFNGCGKLASLKGTAFRPCITKA
jgi:hypothetical protein